MLESFWDVLTVVAYDAHNDPCEQSKISPDMTGRSLNLLHHRVLLDSQYIPRQTQNQHILRQYLKTNLFRREPFLQMPKV